MRGQQRARQFPAMAVQYNGRARVAHTALWPAGDGLYCVRINGKEVGEPVAFDDAHTLFTRINGALQDTTFQAATREGYAARL